MIVRSSIDLSLLTISASYIIRNKVVDKDINTTQGQQ